MSKGRLRRRRGRGYRGGHDRRPRGENYTTAATSAAAAALGSLGKRQEDKRPLLQKFSFDCETRSIFLSFSQVIVYAAELVHIGVGERERERERTERKRERDPEKGLFSSIPKRAILQPLCCCRGSLSLPAPASHHPCNSIAHSRKRKESLVQS